MMNKRFIAVVALSTLMAGAACGTKYLGLGAAVILSFMWLIFYLLLLLLYLSLFSLIAIFVVPSSFSLFLFNSLLFYLFVGGRSEAEVMEELEAKLEGKKKKTNFVFFCIFLFNFSLFIYHYSPCFLLFPYYFCNFSFLTFLMFSSIFFYSPGSREVGSCSNK